MKIALCFIISYDHILNKESIWKEWIEPNKDIINVYFYYKDYKKIKSEWIKQHTIPPNLIFETSYYHVIPAYLSLMRFSMSHDEQNQWICMLTDSCCPIISPQKFRSLFTEHSNKTIMRWRKPWWNINFHKRANLSLLPEDLQLGHEPWFIMKREHVQQCLRTIYENKKLTYTVCNGGLANESLFAIILRLNKQLNEENVISSVTHLTDWTRTSSPTSPHLFKYGDQADIHFINMSLEIEPFAMFIRKVSPNFPDEILQNYIYGKK